MRIHPRGEQCAHVDIEKESEDVGARRLLRIRRGGIGDLRELLDEDENEEIAGQRLRFDVVDREVVPIGILLLPAILGNGNEGGVEIPGIADAAEKERVRGAAPRRELRGVEQRLRRVVAEIVVLGGLGVPRIFLGGVSYNPQLTARSGPVRACSQAWAILGCFQRHPQDLLLEHQPMVELGDGRRLRQLHGILPDRLARLEPHDRLRGRLGVLEAPPVQLALGCAQPELRQQLCVGPRVAEPDCSRGGRKTGGILARLELRGGEIEEQERPRRVCCAGEMVLFNCWWC